MTFDLHFFYHNSMRLKLRLQITKLSVRVCRGGLERGQSGLGLILLKVATH